MYTSILYSIYFINSKPYEETFSNKIEIINEVILMFTFYTFIFYTGISDDYEAIDIIGWVSVGFILLMALFNFGVLFTNIGKLLCWKCKVMRLKRKRKIELYRLRGEKPSYLKD